MSLRHIGIVCENIDNMVEFYKLLGFREFVYSENKGELIDELICLDNTDIKIVKLKSIKDNSIIELLKYKNTQSQIKVNKELYDLGSIHIAINVDNIDELYETFRAIGIKFNSPPLLTDDNVKVCFCRDIENNWIELVEDL